MKTAGSIAPVKTNERPGTRAVVRNVRMSAWKARVVLDLIRDQPVSRAAEILQFTERAAAEVIGKGLASAVANAVNNDGLAAEELFVCACYADEGPTMKRWRPRARGRATRIRKRSTHITILVSQIPSAELERARAVESARSATRTARTTRSAADARRRRVAGSRQEAEPPAIADEGIPPASEASEATDSPESEESKEAGVTQATGEGNEPEDGTDLGSGDEAGSGDRKDGDD